MQRYKISFHSASLALLLGLGLPSIILMFGMLRARQLQSTANPRWSQFAKLSGPQEAVLDPATELTTAVAADRSAPPEPTLLTSNDQAGTNGLTGSVSGRQSETVELSLETGAANKSSYADRSVDTQDIEIPYPPIVFRPVDEDSDKRSEPSSKVLEGELRSVQKRLDELAHQQRQLEKRGDQRQSEAHERELAILNSVNQHRPVESPQPVVVEVRPQVSIIEKESPRTSPEFPPPATSDLPVKPPANENSLNPRLVSKRTASAAPVESAPLEEDLSAPRLSIEAAEPEMFLIPPAPIAAEERPVPSLPPIIAGAEPTKIPHPAGRSLLVDDGISIRRRTAQGSMALYSMEVQDADLRQFLCKLSQESGMNILPSSGVSGQISLSLHDVDLDAALNAIVKSQGLSLQHDGNIVVISTDEEIRRVHHQSRQLKMRIYHPNYVSAAEISRLINPMLSSEGRYSATSPEQSGIGFDETDRERQLDQRDAVIVQDYAEILGQVDQIVAEMDVPPLQVQIEARILRVRLTEEYRNGLEFHRLPCRANCATTAPEMSLKQANLTCAVPVFLRSLGKQGAVEVIATQQIQVLNKHRAEMVIGDRMGLRSGSGRPVAMMDTGTRLVFRPSISADGFVRMEIHPEHNQMTVGQQKRAVQHSYSELTTHVMVQDGASLVLGGMISETPITVRSSSLVGSLPVVGHSFRNRPESLQRSELMVVVTPRIITEGTTSAGELLPPESMTSAEQTASDRHIANAHYQRAVEHYQRGNFVKARQQVVALSRHQQPSAEVIRLSRQIDQSLQRDPIPAP